jgi:sugar phosphate isomerase/epimerase
MGRPVTLFTGQFADIPLAKFAEMVAEWGYDGLELACWGDHFEVDRALSEDGYTQKIWDILEKNGLKCFAIGTHLVGQCVSDAIIDERHKGILPSRLWGDGDPDGVRTRATQEMKDTATAASKFGVKVVTGFTGSPIWHMLYPFPPTPREMIDAGFALFAQQWKPILDVFQQNGVRFALECHPCEIAFDIYTAERALEALNNHPAFGFNFDPSHFVHQLFDPVNFLNRFPNLIYHVHVKDSKLRLNGTNSILVSHLQFGDYRRGWDFISPGHGDVELEEIVRTLNRIQYAGPLSVEWEDNGMNREYGPQDALAFVRDTDFTPSDVAFEAAFASKK